MSCTATLTNVSVGCEAIHLIPLASATQAMIDCMFHGQREMQDALTNAQCKWGDCMFDADLTTVSLYDMFDVLWLPIPEDIMRAPTPWPDKEAEPEHEDNDQPGNAITVTPGDDDGKDDDVESMGQFNDSGMGSETTRHALIEYVHPTNALTCVTELTPDERY